MLFSAFRVRGRAGAIPGDPDGGPQLELAGGAASGKGCHDPTGQSSVVGRESKLSSRQQAGSGVEGPDPGGRATRSEEMRGIGDERPRGRSKQHPGQEALQREE